MTKKKNQKDLKIAKVLLLGEGAVGKTSLANVLSEAGLVLRDFNPETPKVTIGLEIHCLNFDHDGTTYSLSIWDFAGQPQFRFFQPDFMKKGNIGILVFDVTRQSTLLRLTSWKDMAKSQSNEIRLIVVGNKIDSRKRSVPRNAGQSFAIRINAPYLETSATEIIGVKELREKLQELIIEIYERGEN